MRLVKEGSTPGKSLVALEWLRLVAHSDILCSLLEEASSWGDELLKLSKAKCTSNHEMPQRMERQGHYPHLSAFHLSPMSEVGSHEAKGPAHFLQDCGTAHPGLFSWTLLSPPLCREKEF